MKGTRIEGVMYYAGTSKEGNKFYPVIYYYGAKIGSQSYYINEPQDSRSQARTIAKKHIDNLK